MILKNDSDLLKNYTTDDESWMYDSDIETKARPFQWKRPEEIRPKKAYQVWSNVMVCLLFSSIATTWRIMNSCHKVVRSIRNIIFKLKVVCVKHYSSENHE